MTRPGEAFLAFVVKVLTIGAVVVGAALIAAGCLLQVRRTHARAREREREREKGVATARARAAS